MFERLRGTGACDEHARYAAFYRNIAVLAAAEQVKTAAARSCSGTSASGPHLGRAILAVRLGEPEAAGTGPARPRPLAR